MTIAIGGHTIQGGFLGAGTATTTGIVTQASGSTFVGYYVAKQFGAGTFADNMSNTYTRIVNDLAINSTFVMMNVWVCQNGTGGAGHTASFTPANYPGYCAGFLEITGAAVASLDQNPTPTTGSSTAIGGPSATTTAANELLLYIAGVVGNTTFSLPTNSFTILDQVVDGSSGSAICIATNVVSATGTYSSSTTAAATSIYGVAMPTFIQAGAGPPPPVPARGPMPRQLYIMP